MSDMVSAEREFTAKLARIAERNLRPMFPADQWQAAARRVTMAFLDAVKKSRDPAAYYSCTDASIAVAIATTASTGLYPGGPNPTVYLVPKRPRRDSPMELNWWITHRGLTQLAFAAGFMVQAIPVLGADHVVVRFGEVEQHEPADLDSWPSSIDELRGIIVVARSIAHNGLTVCRAWVPLAVIMRRMSMSGNNGSDSIWGKFPVEMAQKTAIKYVFSRGVIPCASQAMTDAMSVDESREVIHEAADGTSVVRPSATARAVSRPVDIPAALPDNGPTVDDLSDLRQTVEPERISAALEREQQPAPTRQQPTPAELKSRAAAQEAELVGLGLPQSELDSARTERGLSPAIPITRSTASAVTIAAYLDDLASLQRRVESASHRRMTTREPGED